MDSNSLQIVSPINFNGIPITLDEPTDLFGRVQVSLPFTQADVKYHIASSEETYSTAEISGSGTSETVTNYDLDLTVSTAVGKRILRSKKALDYQNGQAPMIFLTGNFLTDEPNVTKRIGFSYGGNFIFLENENGNISLHFGSAVPEIAGEIIPRASWNDPLDGTGPFKINLDLTRNVIFFITFQYLGVGALHCGFKSNKDLYTAHIFNINNSDTKPYWSTPNLFLQYEIERTVAGGVPSSLRTICSTIQTQGSEVSQPLFIEIPNDNSFSLGTANIFRPLIAFRLKSAYQNARVLIDIPLLLLSQNNEYLLQIHRNPTLSLSPTWVSYTKRSIEYFLYSSDTTSTVSDFSDVLYSSAGSRDKSTESSRSVIELTVNADGTADYYVLVAKTFANGRTHLASNVTLLEEV